MFTKSQLVFACLALVLLFRISVAGEPESEINRDEFKAHMKLFDDAANLRPLRLNDRDEIRVCGINPWDRHVTDYIVREDGMRRCTARYVLNKKIDKYVVRFMECVRSFNQGAAEDSMNMLDRLSEYNNRDYFCEFDGYGFYIEASHARHILFLSAVSPDECKEPGAKLIARFTDAIWH